MPRAWPALIAFNGGEFSPRVEGRIDIPKYQTGCARLVNFICTPQGPVRRRPGTYFVMDAVEQFAPPPHLAVTPWLMPFKFNSQQAYVLLWGYYTIRFFTNHGYVTTPTAQPPWSGIAVTDGTVVWGSRGKPNWIKSTTVSSPDVIIDTNGNLQLCTTGGNTGASAPFWSTTKGATTVDGTAVWTCYAYEQWQANTAYSLHDLIWAHGEIWMCTTAGTTDLATATGYVTDIYSIPSPFAYADLYDSNMLPALAWESSFDVIYLCHYSKTKRPLKLTRVGATDWRMAPVNIDSGPFQSVNPDSTICVYASAETGTGITITSNSNIWSTDQVGELFFIRQSNIRNTYQWEPAKKYDRGDHARYNGVTYLSLSPNGTTSGTSPPTHLQGIVGDGAKDPTTHVLWEYRDAGYGYARITAVNGLIGGALAPNPITAISNAATAVVTCNSHGFSNGDLVFITGVQGMTEVNNTWFKVAGAAANTFQLNNAAGTAINSTNYAAYTSGGVADSRYYTATADVISDAAFLNRIPYSCTGSDNATSQWAHGAWSDDQGYPNLVKFFRNRLCFYRDGYLWISVSNDFENFNATNAAGLVTDDMAITVAMNTLEPAGWLIEGDALAIGTAGKELIVGEVSTAQALSPTNITKREQLAYGSRRIRSIRIGQETFFVQFSGRKLRSMRFDFYSNSYVSADMSVLADHLTVGGITEMAYQQEPDSTIWAIRSDGALLSFTRQEEQDVAGWSQNVLGSTANAVKVKSIAAIPAPDGTHDELWLLVNRLINGTARYYVEYMTAPFLDGTATADGFFVDCGLRYDGALIPANTAISGLDHLIGEPVNILADGSVQPAQTVDNSGSITLTVDATNVVVGLPQYCDAVKLRLEVPTGAGTSQGTFARAGKITWRFANTVGGWFGLDGQQLDQLTFRDAGDPLDTPIAPYNGDIFQVNMPDGWTQGDVAFRLRYYNPDPLPVELVGIFPQVTVNP